MADSKQETDQPTTDQPTTDDRVEVDVAVGIDTENAPTSTDPNEDGLTGRKDGHTGSPSKIDGEKIKG